MTYFVKFNQNYGYIINYNMTPKKKVYKYLFKVFYRQINRKKYELQILQYNIYYNNIPAMQNTLFLAKIEHKKKKQLAVNIDSTPIAKFIYT